MMERCDHSGVEPRPKMPTSTNTLSGYPAVVQCPWCNGVTVAGLVGQTVQLTYDNGRLICTKVKSIP